MFKNRRSSAKPTPEFYQAFRASYPSLRQSSVSTTSNVDNSGSTLTDALDIATPSNENVGKQGLAPAQSGNQLDNWTFPSTGLTPALFGPGNPAFDNFALQNFYTPTPGGTNVLLHSQHAGDLHTPGIKTGGATPNLLQAMTATSTSSSRPISQGNPSSLQPQQSQELGQMKPSPMFRNINPFQMHNPHLFQFNDPQNNSAACMHAFGFPTSALQMPLQVDTVQPTTTTASDDTPHDTPVMGTVKPVHTETASTSLERPPSHKFRYHVTLNAATAMIKQQNEIPLTYLNKGQTYTLKVQDSVLHRGRSFQPTYRTFVRVSFEDEEQQRNPAACWQLWKEGRGSNEAHHRGGRLQAVEYAGPSSTATSDVPDKPTIEVQPESFDGFCVIWTPAANGPTECALPVRFNFLSTDFSHSKGVKGIPVRLCSKTELLTEGPSPPASAASEVCYCKVKLFRDHGAERKLSNDVAHVKKMIEKTSQQLSQLEAGIGLNGKRKRSLANIDTSRPNKLQKTDDSWVASADKSPVSAEDDLQSKLSVMQKMFSSTRASSVLFLKGSPGDDPDAFPVNLPGAMDLVRSASPEKPALSRIDSLMMSASGSPTSSNQSLQRPKSASAAPCVSRSSSNQLAQQQSHPGSTLQMSNPQNLASPPDHAAVKVKTGSESESVLTSWIEAVDVDHSYQTPAQPQQPVACFYVQPRLSGEDSTDAFHRAVYLRQRQLRTIIQAIFAKTEIEPAPVVRTFRVTPSGLKVLFDDETVAALPEGQDMIAEFCPVPAPATNSPTMVKCEESPQMSASGMAYELKLIY